MASHSLEFSTKKYPTFVKKLEYCTNMFGQRPRTQSPWFPWCRCHEGGASSFFTQWSKNDKMSFAQYTIFL